MRVSISILRVMTALIGLVVLVGFAMPLVHLFDDVLSGRITVSVLELSGNFTEEGGFFGAIIKITNNGTMELRDLKVGVVTQYFNTSVDVGVLSPGYEAEEELVLNVPLDTLVDIIESKVINVTVTASFNYAGLYPLMFNVSSVKPMNLTLVRDVKVNLVSYSLVNNTHVRATLRVTWTNPSFISLYDLPTLVEIVHDDRVVTSTTMKVTVKAYTRSYEDVDVVVPLDLVARGFDYRIYLLIGPRKVLIWEGTYGGE